MPCFHCMGALTIAKFIRSLRSMSAELLRCPLQRLARDYVRRDQQLQQTLMAEARKEPELTGGEPSLSVPILYPSTSP